MSPEDRITLHHSVDKDISRQFTAKCKILNKTPSQMVRELLTHFVKGELRIIANETQMELYDFKGEDKS